MHIAHETMVQSLSLDSILIEIHWQYNLEHLQKISQNKHWWNSSLIVCPKVNWNAFKAKVAKLKNEKWLAVISWTLLFMYICVHI